VNYTVNPNLTPAGYLRADEIPAFLLNRYGQPDFIFAAKSTKSNRPVETITPYSNATGVPIDTTFDDVDNAQIARQLLSEPKYNGKLIVICWRHESIPALAEALHAPATTFPSPWWDEVFNLVLQFDYTKGDPTPKVSSIYEPF
ncbi:MAG: hypothetical protein ABSE82_15470, partial [Nitrososphaerales archaeon]